MSGFAERLQDAMTSRHVGVVELARRAGVSRQTVYNFLRPDYDPISPGLRKIAKALDLDPVELLPLEDDAGKSAARLLDLLRSAAGRKDSRAFEVLPALVAGVEVSTLSCLHPATDAEVRVLGAAAAMAAEMTGNTALSGFAAALRRREDPHSAIFFGRLAVDPVRTIERTPEPLRAHRVFGAFDVDLFRRHLGKV